MIKILDSKNSNYLSKLRLILERRRLGSKINTDNVIKIVVNNLLKLIREKSINRENKFIDINDHFKKMELNLWDYSRPDSHAPINITGDHFHDKGGLMISYRYIFKNMSGNLNGNSEVNIEDIYRNYNSISESNKVESHKLSLIHKAEPTRQEAICFGVVWV